MKSYQKALDEIKKQHLLRHFPLLSEGIDFYSNDYLGYAKSKHLKELIAKEMLEAHLGNGATGSRLLSGNSDYAEAVEKAVATFHNAESALIYPTGYMANLGLISSLANRTTTLVMDELLHASLIDGARLGHAKKVRFKHNNMPSLEKQLKKIDGPKLVIVESVYSMDGDICPLNKVVEICNAHQATLLVDEAHSIGVYGENGNGLVQELGLEDEVMARIMTFGKALGIHGAAVVGPDWLKAYQTNFSRPLIFSTAPSPHHFASILAAYQYLPKSVSERKKLKEIVNYFIEKRNLCEKRWLRSPSHIQTLIIPGNEEVVKMAEQLKNHHINALPIRKPSVPKKEERIRFCLHAYNTKEEVDKLFRIL